MKDTEISLLRTSLAALATQLHDEKQRSATMERDRQRESETLRAQLDEARLALMRLRVANESGKVSTRRMSNSAELVALPARRSSFLEPMPRRRSSLGLGAAGKGSAAIPIPPPVSGLGLGFGAEASNQSTYCAYSTSPNPKPLPLHRLALRRNSGSSYLGRESEEDERVTKLRELQQGLQTLKVASRRGSLARGSGLPDFAPSSAEFEWLERDAEARRRLAVGRHRSISENSATDDEYCYDYGCYEAPPSAPLRAAGRKNSMAMFENWSRRSSTSSTASGGFINFGQFSTYDLKNEEVHTSLDDPRELRLQLEGLRIQLADAEEGRRASELCLKALRSFVAARTDVALPVLPTEYGQDLASDAADRQSGSRKGSIPRLSFSDRATSAAPSAPHTTLPDLAPFKSRRGSSNATLSAADPSGITYKTEVEVSRPSIAPPRGPIRTVSAPIFGGFSFSATTPRRSSVTGLDSRDVSPSMRDSNVFPGLSPALGGKAPSVRACHSRSGSRSLASSKRNSMPPVARGSGAPNCDENESENEAEDDGDREAAARAAAANVSRQYAIATTPPATSPRQGQSLVPLATPSSESEVPSLSSGSSSPTEEEECPFEEDEGDHDASCHEAYDDDDDEDEDDALEAELNSASLKRAARIVEHGPGKVRRAQAQLQSLQHYFQPRGGRFGEEVDL